MPTYDYECEKGHRFEVFQSMKDEPLSACLECGAPAKRVIGPGAGFIFKGAGFYATEYRSKEYRQRSKAESGSAGGSVGGGEGGAASAGDSKGAPPSPKSDASSKPGGGSDSGSGGKSGS